MSAFFISIGNAWRHLLLSGCHYPHSWLVVSDAVCSVAVGALLGFASSEHVSCDVVLASAWSIFAVVVAQTVVAVAVRGRSSLADCAFDALMCTWTSVCALLAALTLDDGGPESAAAQAVVGLLWGAPSSAFRFYVALVAARSKNKEDSEGNQTLQRRRVSSATRQRYVRPSNKMDCAVLSREKMLERLVRRICAARRENLRESRKALSWCK